MPNRLFNYPHLATCKTMSITAVPTLGGSSCELCYGEVWARACNAAPCLMEANVFRVQHVTNQQRMRNIHCHMHVTASTAPRLGHEGFTVATCGDALPLAGCPAHHMSHHSISELGAFSGCASATSFTTPGPKLPEAESSTSNSNFLRLHSFLDQHVCMKAAQPQQLDATWPSSSSARLSRASRAFPPTSTLQAARRPNKTGRKYGNQ